MSSVYAAKLTSPRVRGTRSMARSSPTEDPAAMRRSQEEAWFDTDDDADTPGSSDGGGAEAHDGPREHDRLGREGASVRQDTLQSPSPSFSLDPMQGQGFDPGEAPGPSDGAAAGMGGLAGLQQYSDDDDDEVGAGGSSGAGVQGGVQGDDVAPAEGGGSVGGAWGGAAMRVGVSDAATAGVAAGEGGVRKRAAEGHGGGGGAGAGTGEGWSSGDEGDKRRRVDGSVQGL